MTVGDQGGCAAAFQFVPPVLLILIGALSMEAHNNRAKKHGRIVKISIQLVSFNDFIQKS